jgi:hypothetical protein
MKTVIFALAIMALLLPACAYDQAEFDAFASGVLAATDRNALWNITNDMLVVSRPATQYEIEDIGFAISQAEHLAEAADAIARHFPGEFHESAGSLRVGARPLVGVTIFYPIPEPA